jgi:hypothetical protein
MKAGSATQWSDRMSRRVETNVRPERAQDLAQGKRHTKFGGRAALGWVPCPAGAVEF